MYADKSALGCTVSGACLAATGMDITQVLFWIIAATVFSITGFTLIQMSRAKPSQITTGSVSRKR